MKVKSCYLRGKKWTVPEDGTFPRVVLGMGVRARSQ